MKKCSWCQLSKEYGQIRESVWICHDCFPAKGGFQVIQNVRRCESCGSKGNEGRVLLGRWICAGCCSFFSQQPMSKKGRPKKSHNNKYAKFSKTSGETSKGTVQVFESRKRKRKERHLKLKKHIHWKVVIEDISTGDL